MIESFHIAASGMQAQQVQVDVIANNLTNVNTMGFKKSKVDFEDLMYRELTGARGLLGNPDIRNPVGFGAAVSSVQKVFSQGEIKSTGRSLDVAIEGDGFFEIMLPDGHHAYTRSGSLQVNNEGLLVNGDGYLLSPSIQLPSDTQDVLIRSGGAVVVQLVGEEEPVEIGRIELASFMNPSGLTPVGDNLYLPSHQSGDVLYGEPGEHGFGAVEQGFLESSNVNLIEEVTNLLLAQRGYEMNAKVVQAADEMLSITNNLRR